MSGYFTRYYVRFIDEDTHHAVNIGEFNGKQVDNLCAALLDDLRERRSVRLDSTLRGKFLEWHKACCDTSDADLRALEVSLRPHRFVRLEIYKIAGQD